MLPATDEERDDVTRYYLSQSPGAEVAFLQKVYSETILGHRHDVAQRTGDAEMAAHALDQMIRRAMHCAHTTHPGAVYFEAQIKAAQRSAE